MSVVPKYCHAQTDRKPQVTGAQLGGRDKLSNLLLTFLMAHRISVLSVVAHPCNPGTSEIKAEGFKANLGCLVSTRLA